MRTAKFIIFFAFLIFAGELCLAGTDEIVGNSDKIKTEAQISLKQLGSNNDAFRRKAANELVNMGREAVPILKSALEDNTVSGRGEIPMILAEIGDQSAILNLINIVMTQRDPKLANNSVRALKVFGNPRSVDGLIKALGKNEVDESTKSLIIEALAEITTHNYGRNTDKWQSWWDKNKNQIILGSTELIALSDIPITIPTDKQLAATLEKMKDPNGETRLQGLKEFAESESKEKDKILAQALKLANDPQENIRYCAMRIIGKHKILAGLKALSNLAVNSGDIRTRLEAINALGEIGDIRGIPPIIKIKDENNPNLKDTITDVYYKFNDIITGEQIAKNINSWNVYIQKFCIETIRNRQLKKFYPQISDIIKNDDDEGVRISAIRIAGAMKSKSFIPVLIEVLDKERSSILNVEIISALPQITGVDKGINADNWIGWSNENKAALKEQIDKEALEDKAKIPVSNDVMLYSRDWNKRLARIKEIASGGGDSLESLTVIALRDPVEICRLEAKKVITSYCGKNKDKVIKSLENFDPVKRQSAKDALILSGDAFLSDIATGLKSDSFIISKSCAEILAATKKKDGVDPLIAAIKENRYKGVLPSPYSDAAAKHSGAAAGKLITVAVSANEAAAEDALYALSKINKRYLVPAVPYFIKKLRNADIFAKETFCKTLADITNEKIKICREGQEWGNKKIKKYPDLQTYSFEEGLSVALLREQKENLNAQFNNLFSTDPFAFEKAKKYLIENSDEETLTKILELTKTNEPKIKEVAVSCLLAAPEISTPLILNNIASDVISIQECVLLAAEKWETPQDFKIANSILRQCLLSSNKNVKVAALKLLASFEMPENAESFARLLSDSDSMIRAEAVYGIFRLFGVQYVKHITDDLEVIYDPYARLRIASYLSMFGNNAGAKYFIKLLGEGNADKIKQAAPLFPPVLTPEFETPIIDFLKKSPADQQGFFLTCLGYIGGQKSSEFIKSANYTSNPSLAKNSEIALQMIGKNAIIFE